MDKNQEKKRKLSESEENATEHNAPINDLQAASASLSSQDLSNNVNDYVGMTGGCEKKLLNFG